MFSIVVCVIVGILVFLCGYLAGWNNYHSKIKVGTPSTYNQQAQDEICSYHLPACVCTWDENRACEVTPCYPIRKLSSMR